MNEEMVDMTNREILLALMGRMDGVENMLGDLGGKFDTLETGQKELRGKIDTLEAGQKELHVKVSALEAGQKELHGRIDTLEDNVNMEIQAVRTEMEMVYKSLKQDVRFLNDKVDRIMILKDVDGVEKMKIRLDVLEQGYQSLNAKLG